MNEWYQGISLFDRLTEKDMHLTFVCSSLLNLSSLFPVRESLSSKLMLFYFLVRVPKQSRYIYILYTLSVLKQKINGQEKISLYVHKKMESNDRPRIKTRLSLRHILFTVSLYLLHALFVILGLILLQPFQTHTHKNTADQQRWAIGHLFFSLCLSFCLESEIRSKMMWFECR